MSCFRLSLGVVGLTWLAVIAPPAHVGAGVAPTPNFPELAAPEHDRAVAALRALATTLADARGLTLSDTDAAPFLIYSDWPKGDVPALRAQLSQAYREAARRLGARRGQNVFAGRLLVLAVRDRETFGRVVEDLEAPLNTPDDLAAFAGRSDGLAVVVLCRPEVATGQPDSGAARRELQHRWLSATTRVMCAAAVFRLHRPAGDPDGAAELPPWLGRGLATMIQHDIAPPRPQETQYLRDLANVGNRFDLELLFADELPAGPFIDAAAASVVRLLARRDRSALDGLLRRCRNGQRPEAALQDTFGWDYEGLLTAWRKHLQTARH